MLSKIKVYGRLAKFLGQRSFYAEVKSPIEAFKFLVTNFPKLQAHAMQQNYCIKVGTYDITNNDLNIPVGSQEIKIVPVVVGARRGIGRFITGAILIGATIATGGFGGAAIGTLGLGAGSVGVGTIVTGIGASLMLSGATEMLFPIPKPPAVSDDPQERNFSFNGVQNTSRAGIAIPIVYGETFTGSLVVSAGIDTEDIL